MQKKEKKKFLSMKEIDEQEERLVNENDT